MLTIDGLVTGIDTEKIISGLLDIQQTQIDRLQVRRQSIQGKQAAYESLEVQLRSLDSIADQLARPQSSVFHSRTVSVSNESRIFANASTRAAVGTYQLHVDELARTHQVVSNGFSAADAELTQGTIDISLGSATASTITIDSSNNTLEGLANAINASDAGISATLINDGTTFGTPFRLLLTANETGVENSINLVNSLALSSGNAVLPEFDFGNPVQTATNAQVRLGTGVGALTVVSASNEIENLIQGVTLNLLSADAGQELQIRVEADPQPSGTAIKDLVDTYNAIMDFIDELVRFDSETDRAGLLIGDRTVSDIQNDLRSVILDVVPGLDSGVNRLSVLGISLNNNTRLTVNETRLVEVLSGRVEGISENDVKNLFSSSTSGSQFIDGIGVRLGSLINDLTDIEGGELTAVQDGLLDQLGSLDNSISRQQAIFDAQQADLIAQFVALESAISELQTTSSFLTRQLSNLGRIGDN